MWLCYVAFCLERLKRKTNVQELKDKVQENGFEVNVIIKHESL